MTIRRFNIPGRIIGPLLTAGYLVAANASSGIPSSKLYTDPYPARWNDASGLYTSRFGRLSFTARDGNQLEAITYKSTSFNPKNGPIWFVIHGASRATELYINTAAPVAERHNALAVAIHFPKAYYPSFTLGVTSSGKPNARALEEGRWREPDDYLHAEIEHVFEAIRQTLGGEQPGYLVFGHSAGAQFTHRLLTFRPDARVLGAVAANAGWYTLPIDGSSSSYTMPYGLGQTPLSEADLKKYLALPMVVLVGERDTKTPAMSSMVRGTREAMMQGRNRRERGEYFFEMGESRGRALETKFGWQFATVPHAKHSVTHVMGSAAFFLFTPDDTPCTTSSLSEAKGLVVTELLADPPRGMRGDANADGVRDPSDDEFVELVNTSNKSICLSGWSLGDARKSKRHVFPIGSALAPGETMVVFGGGIPTGGFHAAAVQWAAYSGRLNLNKDGDVLSLRDAAGEIATQISWGDCGGAVCAAEHLDFELNIDSSIVRQPEQGGEWASHLKVAGTPFSPGLTIESSEQKIAMGE